MILVNCATGYIGSRTGTVGAKFFTSAEGVEVQADNSIDVYIGQIFLRLPNLKIKAECEFTAQAGLTQGATYQNLIGFEGAGTTSDKLVAISTQ